MSVIGLYEIPTVWLGLLVVGAFVAASLAGLWATRPLVRRFCRAQNDFANFFLATVAVFYAVLVGLIAVACWGNYTAIAGIVSNEAVSASDVYRDVESYPPAVRDEVRGLLSAYVRHVIGDEWPTQRQGLVPSSKGDEILRRAGRDLATFEPATPGQQVLHGQTLRDLDDLFSNRRLRLEAVDSHLPRLMWLVVLAGAAITIFMTYFFCAESDRLHSLLTGALGVLIGLVIFLILALDRPLVAQAGVDTRSFEGALSTMEGKARGTPTAGSTAGAARRSAS